MKETNSKKLFSQKGIAIATFFGGPLAAGYLIRQNFISLGKEREGLVSIILGIVITTVIFSLLFMLPDNIVDKIPNQLLPAIYTAIIYAIVESVQGKNLKSHKESGGQFQSNWKATGIGLLWMLVIVAAVVLYYFMAPEYSGQADREVKQKLEQIYQNEEKALKFYGLEPQTSTEDLVKAVKDEGILYWNLNLQLLEEIQQYELEEPYEEYINKLFIYTRLRQEIYILILQALQEDTDKYDREIEQKNRSVQAVLNEIDQMAI